MTTIPGTGSGREPAKRCRVPRWLHGGSKVDFDGLGGPARAPGGVTAQAWRPSGYGGRDRRSIVPTSGRSFRPNRSCSCSARGPAGNSAAVTGPARILPLPPLGAPPQVGSRGMPARPLSTARPESPREEIPRSDAGRHSPYGRRIEIERLQAAGGKRQAPAVPARGREERMDSSNRGRRQPQDYCGAFQTMSWTFTGLGISFCS